MGQLPVVNAGEGQSCCRWAPWMSGVALGIMLSAIAVGSYFFGKSTASQSEEARWNGIPVSRVPAELLQASATHGTSNLAICTGRVDDDAEGFFALDFLTGELKAWVYYPRQGAFGGLFATNVQPALGVNSKNPEYLLVSGEAMTIGQSSNVRPAQCLIYVVDVRSGFFAAYTIPWNRTLENSASAQMGSFVYIGGGQIREPQGGAKKPANPPKAPGPGGAGPGPGAGNPAGGNANPAAGNPAGGNPAANPGAGKQPAGGAGNKPEKGK
jgi:hypothetical protein